MRGLYKFIGIIAVSWAISLAVSHTSFASGSWTSGTFAFDEEVQVQTSNNSSGCTVRTVRIGGALSTTSANVCVYERPNWRYGFYTQASGPPYAPYYQTFFVAGIGTDSGMYKVANPGYGQSHEIVHLPGTDGFMYNRLTMGFTNNRNLFIARNFPSKLVRSNNGVEVVYELADNSYEPLISNAQNEPVTTGAVGVSENGRWIATEVMGTGLALIDTQTYKMRLFSNYKHRYGVGSDAHIRFVISNDGNYVAAFDYNIQPKVYTLSQSCVLEGDSFDEIATHLAGYESCPDDGERLQTALVDKFGAQQARSQFAQRFNYDGDTLHFTRSEFDDDTWEETAYDLPLRAGGYQRPENLQYLALGDSYASGEGDAGKPSHYTSVTDSIGGCHISRRSYPFLIQSHYSIPFQSMKSVACAGAQVVFDYYRPLEGYRGQSNRLGGRSLQERLSEQEVALEQFIPGKVPQLEFVKKYQPQTVTVMGGGNDVGFADILIYCATPTWENAIFWLDSDCDYANEGSALETMLYDSIDTQYLYNKRLLEKIKEVSPSTKVILVGYPSFITHRSPTGCTPNSGALTISEIKMINKMVTYMNDMLKKLAHDTSSSFADVEESLNGGRICEGAEYMTGTWSRIAGGAEQSEMFHPNAKGHQKMAESIIDSGVFAQASIPSGSSFDATKEYEISRATPLLPDGQVLKGEDVQMSTTPYLLAPGSEYTVTMYSSPVDLGTFTADGTGQPDATISFADAPLGHHVLVLEGVSSSGEPVKFYQFIRVGYSESDTDGDGIPDADDNCTFVTQWFNETTGKDMCQIATNIKGSASEKKMNLSSMTPHSTVESSLSAPTQQDGGSKEKIDLPLTSTDGKNITEPDAKYPVRGKEERQKGIVVLTVTGLVAGVICAILIRRNIRKRYAKS